MRHEDGCLPKGKSNLTKLRCTCPIKSSECIHYNLCCCLFNITRGAMVHGCIDPSGARK